MTQETRDLAEARNAMSFGELVAWAWQETPPVHTNRTNLLIHLFAVPLFVVGHVLIVSAIASGWVLLVAGIFCIAISLLLQNIGHSLERTPVHPFLAPGDFLRRLYAEQFCNFWRFFASGSWYASFRQSR